MIFWVLKQIKKLLTQLNSTESPSVLAMGVVFGVLLGLPPFHFFYVFLVVLLMLILKVNIGFALISLPLFKALGVLLSLLAHQIGLFVLQELSFLKGLWTFLFNLPLIPYTGFNHTVTMGSYVLSAVLGPIVFFGTRRLIGVYRRTIKGRIERSKFMTVLKSSRYVGWIFRFLAE